MKCQHSTLFLHELNFEFVNLRRRSIILLTLLCTFTQSVNQLHWSETIDLTISQMVFSFSCYVWKQSNMVHEKIDCNTSYVQAICMIYLVAWSGNNEDLWLCLWFSSLAFFDPSILNPTSVRVLTVDCVWARVSSHWQKTGVSSQQVMLLVAPVIVTITFWWLLAICNIIAIPGVKTFIECHVIEFMWLRHNQHPSVC